MRKKDRHELPSPIQPQLVLSLCARFLKKGTIVLEIAVTTYFFPAADDDRFFQDLSARRSATLRTFTPSMHYFRAGANETDRPNAEKQPL